MPTTWVVVPTCLPTIVRRCHACASMRFRASGKFRVNANHKLLDAWLLALCTVCGDTTKLTVFERTHVRSVRAELLDRLHNNDRDLVAELLRDPIILRRNRIGLDWANAWRLDIGGSDQFGEESFDEASEDAIDIAVRFAARIPVRPVRLIADGLGMSRGEVERLAAEGKLVSVIRLCGKRSNDFAFLLKR